MKQIKWIGIIGFSILLIASVVFFKERVLYADSAYYAFNLINEGWPAAEHNRNALYLYQLIPWAMLKMNFSITSVLVAFSFCHVLVHALVFFILLKIKQPRIAMLLLLMQVLGIRESYFLTVNETALAISFSLLLLALLYHFKSHPQSVWKQTLCYALCILMAVFSHPMAIIILLFVFTYYFLSNRLQPNNKNIAMQLGIGFIGAFILKKIISHGSGYEDDLYAQLNNTSNILANLKGVYSFNFFVGGLHWQSYFFYMYFIPVGLFLVAILYFIKNKQYSLLGFYALSVVGFWLLIIVFFNRGDGNIFMEKNFLPWIVITLLPFVNIISLKDGKFSNFVMVVLIIIMCYQWKGVYDVKTFYVKRIQRMDALITKENPLNSSKILYSDSCMNYLDWGITWALPYETLLLSKIDGIRNTSVRIYKNEPNIQKELYRTDIFLGADFMSVLPSKDLLNEKYFRLRDEPYSKLKCP